MNTRVSPELSHEKSTRSARTSVLSLALAWLASRIVIVVLGIWPERYADGDIRHYWKQIAPMFHGHSARHVLVEYPLPVLSFLWPLDRVAGGDPRTFNILFAISMLVVDGAFTAFLIHLARQRRTNNSGAWLWILFGLLMGPVLIFRFDVVCGVLAAMALIYAISRPARSGAALAIAVAAKLWPAALLPILLMPREGRKKLFLGASITGAIVLMACVALEGMTRTLSPLKWQNARGLQIESVSASVALIQRTYEPKTWKAIFQFGAVEITGPGVNIAEKVSSLALLASVIAVAAFLVRYRRSFSFVTLGWVYLLVIALLIVTNKTYSAQYIIWLAAPCAIFLPLVTQRRVRLQLAALILAIALLTHIEYPLLYNHLWPKATSWDVVVVLVTRNVLILVITAVLGRQAVKSAQADAVTSPTR